MLFLQNHVGPICISLIKLEYKFSDCARFPGRGGSLTQPLRYQIGRLVWHSGKATIWETHTTTHHTTLWAKIPTNLHKSCRSIRPLLFSSFQAAFATIQHSTSQCAVYKVRNTNLQCLCERFGVPASGFDSVGRAKKVIYRSIYELSHSFTQAWINS